MVALEKGRAGVPHAWMDGHAAEFTMTPEGGHGSSCTVNLQAARSTYSTVAPVWHGHRHLFSRARRNNANCAALLG